MPFPIIFKSLTIGTFLCVSSAAAVIPNWDINFLQLLTDFSNGSTDEITLKYEIGAERSYQVDLFDKGCTDPITGTNIITTHVVTTKDATHDLLDVLLDLDKSTITTSNIWNPLSEKIEMCVRVQLLSGLSIIKEEARDIDIKINFDVDFTTVNSVDLNQASVTLGSGSTEVDSYVQACTCDDASSFTCNTDSIGPNSNLNICIKSLSDDMNVHYVNSLEMTQEGTGVFVIIEANNLKNAAISSLTDVPGKNGVHVASIIPSQFFKYSGTSTAVVTGVVYLKLTGGRRQLAVDITGFPKVQATGSTRALGPDRFGDQVSPLVIDLLLDADKELELVVTDLNSGAKMNRFLGFVTTATGLLATIML